QAIMDALRLFLDRSGRCPISFATANLEQKVAENLRAKRCVRYFRMELQSINASSRVLESIDCISRLCGHAKSVGKLCNVIAMAHPDIHLFRQTCKQAARRVHDGQTGVTVLSTLRRQNFSAQT